MLGYTFARLHDTPEGLGWNMVYESFGIHARVLYDFLQNKGQKGNDFRADKYTDRWTPSNANLAFNDLNTFVAHLSEKREVRPKLTLSKLQELGAWLDKEWARWVETLPEGVAPRPGAAPVCVPPKVLLNGVTLATACTTVTATAIDFSAATKFNDLG